MKYVVVLVVVGVVLWLLLRSRSRTLPVGRRSNAAGKPQAMVACEHCGIHLPRGDALVDGRGVYCSEAHRLAGPRVP